VKWRSFGLGEIDFDGLWCVDGGGVDELIVPMSGRPV